MIPPNEPSRVSPTPARIPVFAVCVFQVLAIAVAIASRMGARVDATAIHGEVVSFDVRVMRVMSPLPFDVNLLIRYHRR